LNRLNDLVELGFDSITKAGDNKTGDRHHPESGWCLSPVFIYLFVFASFSNTLSVFFQDAAYYQIWQASVFHETLSQLPGLWYPIDISPPCSPTFLVFT